MQAPRFWFEPPGRRGLCAQLLWPAERLWHLGSRLRHALSRPDHPGVPVVCVGNLTVGGSGKTPLVAALAERLAHRGMEVHIVSRGYGGRAKGPLRVDPARHDAADVGDEPLLLAATAPVWVARDRAKGARAAAEAGAQAVLLDDGFQNPGLIKDVSVLAVDAGVGFGNLRLVPAGPLREGVAGGLRRADAVCLIGEHKQRTSCLAATPELTGVPLIEASLEPPETGLELDGMPVVAFAGIGRPEKFFETLEGLGARLVARHGFPDHHVYAPRVVRRLIAEARGQGAMLVTTEKDAVRLPPALRREAMAVPVRLVFDDSRAVDALLDKILKGIKKTPATKLP